MNIEINQAEQDNSVAVRIESTASLTELADFLRDFSKKDVAKLRRVADIYRKADQLRTELDELDAVVDKLRTLSKKEYKETFALCKTLRDTDEKLEKAQNLENEMSSYRRHMAGGIRD